MLGHRTAAVLLAALALLAVGCAAGPKPEPQAEFAAAQSAFGYDLAATKDIAPVVPSEWHAFLIAGSTLQRVFDNFVADFGNALASQGVEVRRFSSRSPLPAGTELAIQARIRASAPPSPARDAGCLIYVTSHGTPGFLFMTADWLAEMVAILCGERPTVIVLSGCYAGSLFTGRVPAENRIVIAAARKDRRSFGCTNDRYLNNFDQCFLDSWRWARNWPGLFDATFDCVRWTEPRGYDPPSEPQAFFGRDTAGLTLPGKRRAGD